MFMEFQEARVCVDREGADPALRRGLLPRCPRAEASPEHPPGARAPNCTAGFLADSN